MEEWPADINDLIEFLPQLEDARYQLDIQLINLRQDHWNERLSDPERYWNKRLLDPENYESIPGLKQLSDLCDLYDQRIGSFPKELSIRMYALSMAELLQRRKAYNLAGKERLEYAYQCAVEKRMRDLFSNLRNFWEPQVLRGEFAYMDHIDFQAIIQNLREWYAFMCDPQNIRFSAHDFLAQESLGRIPEYIERFEAVRDAMLAWKDTVDTMNQARDLAFMQATHPRLGATAGVNELSQELLRDITRYSRDRTPNKRAPWVQIFLPLCIKCILCIFRNAYFRMQG